MIILGVDRNAGQFENPQKEVINFDHVLVNAVSGDNDKRDKRYVYSSGKWVAVYKIRTEDFLEAFSDLQKPFDDCRGIDVVPNYNQYGKVVGFIRR